jgi:glutamyl-tRNA synthetase
VAPLVQERVATLGEIPDMVEFFFRRRFALRRGAFAKVITNDAVGEAILEEADRSATSVWEWEAAPCTKRSTTGRRAWDLALRKAQAPIRCAVTGTLVGPPLFESLELLGRKRTIQRLRDALARTGVIVSVPSRSPLGSSGDRRGARSLLRR